jgi:hypothetical protein
MFILDDCVPVEWLLIFIFEYIPFLILFQWLEVRRKYAITPGYLLFLADAIKQKSSDSTARLPTTDFNILVKALARYGDVLTDGYVDDLVAVLTASSSKRKGKDPLTVHEIGYAIKLKLISDSYAKPRSERKKAFAEFAENFSRSISPQGEHKNLVIEKLLSVYDKLPDECISTASLSNPDSIAMRLRQWQLTTYRIGIISAIVLTVTAILALL